MKKFIVEVPEVHIQEVEVMANNEEQAARIASDGDGEEVGCPRYHYTLDNVENWNVYEKPE